LCAKEGAPFSEKNLLIDFQRTPQKKKCEALSSNLATNVLMKSPWVNVQIEIVIEYSPPTTPSVDHPHPRNTNQIS